MLWIRTDKITYNWINMFYVKFNEIPNCKKKVTLKWIKTSGTYTHLGMLIYLESIKTIQKPQTFENNTKSYNKSRQCLSTYARMYVRI